MRIEGARVRLRDWEMRDLGAYAHWMKPGHRWQAFDAPFFGHPTEDEIPGIVSEMQAYLTAGEYPEPRIFLVVADPASDRLIGQVSHYWISEETNWLAAGIVIYDPALWGNGLASEALGLWIDYLFHTMPQLARMDLQTWSGNPGAARLCEKLGFQLEGRFRKARIVEGQHYDALGYGILREEWQARYPQGFSG
jgi:putative hydrolase of HD superfamily